VPPTAFRFIVQQVFSLATGGAVVEGRIEAGHLREGQQVAFRSPSGRTVAVCVITIERTTDRQLIPEAAAGEEVRLLLPDVNPSALAPGLVLEANQD
jgi:translation elongation factor EF-1alpha